MDKFFDLKIQLNNFQGKSGIDIVNKITEILKNNNINPSSVMIQDTENYKHIKLTLKNMESFFGLPKEEILKSYKINWYMISKYSDMTEGFMRFADDKIAWDWICKRVNDGGLKVSKKFKEEYECNFEDYNDEYTNYEEEPEDNEPTIIQPCANLDIIIKDENRKKKELNDLKQLERSDRYRDTRDRGKLPNNVTRTDMGFKLKWEWDKYTHRNTNGEDFDGDDYEQNMDQLPQGGNMMIPPFMFDHIDESNMDEILDHLSKTYNIPKDKIIINTYNPMTGDYIANINNNPSVNSQDSEDDKDLVDQYITLENYKKYLIDFDNYDSNMWSWISRKLWMSPEFVDKFRPRIYLSGLTENPHFGELMKCDWFFDKYISTLKELKTVQNQMNKHMKVKLVNMNDKIKCPNNEM